MYEQFSKTLVYELQSLLNELPIDSQGEKFLLGHYNEKALDEIFIKVMALCNETVEIKINNNKNFTFRAWKIGNKMVIPCRVRSDQEFLNEYEPNSCTREFNGKLRDFFYISNGHVIENRVLLTLDKNPIETQKASNPLSQLNVKSFLNRVITRNIANSVDREHYDNIIQTWINESGALDAKDIEIFLNQFNKSLTEETPLKYFVQNLSKIGFLNVRGENVENLKEKRLMDNIRLKQDLTSLFSPELIFEQEIFKMYKEPFAHKIIASHQRNEDFTKVFFYEEFTENTITENTKEEKLQVTKVEVSGKEPFDFKKENNKNSYLFKVELEEEQFKLKLHFNRTPNGESLFINNPMANISFSVDKLTGIKEDFVEFDFNINSLKFSEFTFFGIDIKKGATKRSKTLKELQFGIVYSQSDQKVFYEKHLKIDIENQAFSIKNNKAIQCVLEGDKSAYPTINREIQDVLVEEGPCSIEFNELNEGDELFASRKIELQMSSNGDVTKVPVLLESSYQLDEDPAINTISNLFKFLLDQKIEAKEEKESKWKLPPLNILKDHILFNGIEFEYDADLKSLIRIENKVRSSPETLTWYVHGNIYDNAATISEHNIIENLSLWKDFEPYAIYIESRKTFFQILEDYNVVSVTLNFLSENEKLADAAKKYVEDYVNLCKSITNYDESTREVYARALYTDIITTASEELFISPTHPLYIQYLFIFGKQVTEWLNAPMENFIFGKKDISSLSPAYYIPYLQFNSIWYELVDSKHLCWSRYQASERNEGEGIVPDYVSRIIQDKIKQFRETHPVLFYQGHFAKLLINVINPGDGKYLSDALLRYFKEDNSSHRIYINLIGEGHIGSYLDYIFTCEEPPVGVKLESLTKLRENVSYTKSDSINDLPYAHLTFLINQYHAKLDREYKLDSFPSSIYVNGLLPKVTRKLAPLGPNDESYTYLQGLWTGILDEDDKDASILPLMSNYLQEHFRSMRKILNPNVGMVKSVTINPAMLKEEFYLKSRWLIHLDREIGLEVFSKNLNEHGERPLILEYSRQYNPYQDGFDVITTTSHLEPYIQRVKDILNLSSDNQAAEAVRILNSLSGRWALKLMQSNSNEVADRTANVIAYKYLKLIEKVLKPTDNSISIIVSLEEFLRVTGKLGLPLSEGATRNLGEKGSFSDDLLLITIHKLMENECLKIDARIIEVKFGSSSLKKGVEQVKRTHTFFANRFGNTLLTDQLFRSMDFANLVLDGVEKAILFKHLSYEDLRNMNFDNLIYPNLINGNFNIHLDGNYKGQRFYGDILHVNPEQNSSFNINNGEVRVITIPKKFFVPLLEESLEDLGDIVSTYTLFSKDTKYGLFHELNNQNVVNKNNENQDENNLVSQVELQLNNQLTLDYSHNAGKNSRNLKVEGQKSEVMTLIPKSEIKVYLGNQLGTEHPVYWDHRRDIDNPLVNHNLTITGDPGKGKTQTVKSIIHELRLYDLPLLMIDFKDDYIEEKFLLEENINLVDVLKDGLPFNPLEPFISDKDNDFMAIEEILKVEQLLKRIFKLGDQQSNQLRKAMIEAFIRKGINPQSLTKINEIGNFPTLNDVHNILLEDEKKHETLISRISLLFQLELFDKQTDNKITFTELMNGSYTIRLTRLPGNELKAAVAELLILAIHNYLLSGEQPRRLTRSLVLDEAHRVSQSDALLEMMREGRAFGIGVIISTQFPSDIRTEIYGCTESKLFLGNDQFEHAEAGAIQLDGGASRQEIKQFAEQIRSLATHQAFIRNFHYPKMLVDIIPYYKRINNK
ncbi:hypothetical protein C2I28_26920 (plasmid) [Priestia megaterium]|uniref:ATP-binding protein n=1 Tax=Priestia megaterium TaxID=1404 RepID=UPI000D505989|nr:DUF87 domain-containing protein [Priestia megaterium]AWD68663.1 hypothetical protein C2I28_26920 [Priestia megaterium]